MTTERLLVLGIETSCDETGVAVVENGTRARSNVVASSEEFHRRFGGVVPEIASRKQVEVISAVAQEALDDAGVSFGDLSAVAVTYAPGLVGSLVVGVCFAKALAFAHRLPLVAVHHIEAHIYAHFIAAKEAAVAAPPEFPFLALVVSGGHSDLIAVRGHGEYEMLGRTRDDAAGEAFDKGARLLGLGYPGGPAMDAAARNGNAAAVPFPRALIGERGDAGGLPGRDSRWDFSFSGVKTALARFMRETPEAKRASIEDLAASYQEAVVAPLVAKSLGAAQELGFDRVLVAGGVANNSRLRAMMAERAAEAGIEVRFPPPQLCTDNAAMVASAGYFRYRRGQVAGLDLDAYASAKLT
ncbi:MAG: tRNA (adenosine(37)-N6)-threonylcarbamoyltransferase complex transferase subunit TsaD [Armatimonadota bacterium]|nr:MAG: tRNA (adenosine(37)-N6)-threonylcarbamoyltransferase complex transferase subunit TsaD [Armatimonadota bacterium]